MTEVIEYDSDNQFITVGSGMSLAALQEKLGENNQWLPVRPPFFKETSTTGSIIAMAAVGPERAALGAPRDYLLGLQYIDSSGSMVTTGGKVVKNVAGYDMTRLMTGSAGTLGFITEASWRVAARPEACKVTSAVGSLESCSAAALAVINSNLLPVFVTAVPQDDSWKLMIGFEGLGEVVDHQIDRCDQKMSENGLSGNEKADYPVIEGPFKAVFDGIWEAPYVCQADVVIANVKQLCEDAVKITETSSVLVDFACGRVYAGFEGLNSKQWSELDAQFNKNQGHGKLIKAPEEFRNSNDVFGSGRAEWKLSHKVKAALDPNSLFSPGVLPGRA